MRVAITGATGFLGGHLLDRLLAQGHAVTALVRRNAQAATLRARGVKVIEGDLTGLISSAGAERVDAFVHAAALSSNWGLRPAFIATNVHGTTTALELSRRLGAKRFVQISSPSIYFRFADQFGVRENEPLPRPVNAYAESKQMAEALVLAARDLDPVILRPRGIYGRGDVALLPRLVRAAARGPLPLLRDGGAVTDLTHVDDVVSAILCALNAPAAGGLAINISGGEALGVVDVAEKACARLGVSIRWRRVPISVALATARLAEAVFSAIPGRPEPIVTAYSLGVLAYSQTLDLARAKSVLGWQPAIGFDDGLARL